MQLKQAFRLDSFHKRKYRQSKDAFPLEFLHIANRHACILGEDPLPNFTIDLQALRLQNAKRELRGQLIQFEAPFCLYEARQDSLRLFLDAERSVYCLYFMVFIFSIIRATQNLMNGVI